MKTYKSIIELIGNTPLIELSRISAKYGCPEPVYGKAERFNPCGSSKDRAALYMLNDALESGRIGKSTVIIEATSGNTGVALAALCAVYGMRCVLTMPENMSEERRKLLSVYGAELVLTPASEGMNGAVAKAKALSDGIKDSFIPDQFSNPSNRRAHFETTARELWEDTDGTVGTLIAGVGSGGTVSGIAEFLKAKNKNIKIYAVQPFSSPVLSGGVAGSHRIQGIGANFVPANFDRSLVDGIISVTDDEAYSTSRDLAKTEGLLCGISSGASVFAAMNLIRENRGNGGLTVAIMPDTGERYLSVL